MSEMNTNKIPGDSRPRHNIVLIGFMGTGKSSVAQYLHDTCHMEVADMDEIIAARENMSIPEIFSSKGKRISAHWKRIFSGNYSRKII